MGKRNKVQKIKRRLGHIKNCILLTLSSKKSFFKWLRKKHISLRIFLGIGGIKPLKMPLNIIEENSEFLVLSKDPKILCHPTKHNEPDTLLNGILHHLGIPKNEPIPGIIGRLDRNTSGVMLIAKTPEAKSMFGKFMMNKRFEKKYITLVKGKTPDYDSIIKPLCKAENDHYIVVDEINGKFAHTDYKRTHYFPKYNASLLSVQIHTGKTHQIRAHLSSIGHPIIGDYAYGDNLINELFKKEFSLQRQFLHAHSLKWLNNNKKHSFYSELCQDLKKILAHLKKND